MSKTSAAQHRAAKRLRDLRSYLRQPGFKGVWLNREDAADLVAWFGELVDEAGAVATERRP